LGLWFCVCFHGCLGYLLFWDLPLQMMVNNHSLIHRAFHWWQNVLPKATLVLYSLVSFFNSVVYFWNLSYFLRSRITWVTGEIEDQAN
jgi:hypothetical protein